MVGLDPLRPQGASAPKRESSEERALDRQHVLELEPRHAGRKQEPGGRDGDADGARGHEAAPQVGPVQTQ